jgi:transcriptional regulator of heat shock response
MVKIKTVDAVKGYNELKTLKLSTIDDDIMLNIWRNIKTLRKVAEEYKKDIEDSRNAINDGEYDDMQQRLFRAKRREEEVKNGERVLTAEEIKDVDEINKYFAVYADKVKIFSKEIEEKEIDIDIVKISDENFLKVLKANGKDFDFMEQFSWMLC